MPYDSVSEAKDANFPTKLDGVRLRLHQINKLAKYYDAIKAEGNVDNAMAVAISKFKSTHKIVGSGDDRRWKKKGN